MSFRLIIITILQTPARGRNLQSSTFTKRQHIRQYCSVEAANISEAF